MSLVYMNYVVLPKTKDEEIKYATKLLDSADYKLKQFQTNAIQSTVYRYSFVTPSYKTFMIPKHKGGFRTIEAPNDELMEAQRAILKAIYAVKYVPTNNAHGFTKYRNCKTAMQVHQKKQSRWFLKLDIKDAFGSTTRDMLVKAFRKVEPFARIIPEPTRWDATRDRLLNLTTHNGVLPQGAPTSPMLLNIVLTPFDYKLNKYCKEHGLVYTRYADDILISSRVDWDYNKTVEAVTYLLEKEGYALNTDKIRYGSFNGRNWNLGTMFNNKYELTIGHKKHHELKCRVHNYLKNPTWEEYYALQGALGYWKYIEHTNETYTGVPETLIKKLNENKPER